MGDFHTQPVGEPARDLVAVLRDMRTPLAVSAADRIEELTKALEWQPIETAPKDRKRILLYQAGRGAFEGWWHTAWPHPEEYWMDDADSEPNPTHWRPTLAPPLEDRK